MTLPEDFIRETRQAMGEERFARLVQGLQEEVPVSIRVNERKLAGASLAWGKVVAKAVPWCPTGYYLSHRPEFTFDPLLHAGAYYVQEASSMFVDHVLRHVALPLIGHPESVLDLCASPGGKSTCLRSALPDECILYSNEPIRPRAQILNENILKWGHPNVIVTNNYACDYQRSGLQFDLILADVPCSGEGMFRKDAQAIDDWSLQKVEQCRLLQRDIIADIWPCLKPGGVLIYSTCTFNTHENEENVLWTAQQLGAELIEIPTDPSWNITGSLTADIPVCRFLPGTTQGEGLFMAALQKAPGETSLSPKKGGGLRILSHGPLPPQQKGKDLIPDVSEALSLKEGKKYPRVAIAYDQAIAYLRKEAITLPADAPHGIVTVTFNHMPLGFAKNIGARANNLYPKEWKIKTTHIPSDHEAIFSLA